MPEPTVPQPLCDRVATYVAMGDPSRVRIYPVPQGLPIPPIMAFDGLPFLWKATDLIASAEEDAA